MMDIIFENAINLFQSVVVTAFLMASLGCKDKYNKKCIGIIGIVTTFIYLTVSNHIVFFESAGIYIYMVYSLIFSFLVLGGNVIEKIFYNIMMLCCLAGSALLGVGLISLVVKKDYLNTVQFGVVSRYISGILVQILLIIFFLLLIKLKTLLKEKDNKYLFIMSMIPAISVIICCFMVYRSDKSYEMNVIYTFIAMIGIIIINVISIFLLIMEQKLYEQKIRQQVMLSAYQQKEKDVESILDMQKQNSKQRHDIKNVLILIRELIQDEKYSMALEVLDKYSTGYKNINVTEIVSNNIVLNYLLNRKINECRDNGIDMGCYVLGNIEGIDDMDLYILLENLCDNAIEAARQCDNSTIRLQISENNDRLYIDIGNTTMFNVLKSNPDMNTTKKDKEIHGFGIMNIRDIIDKYNGTINYEQHGDNYLMCRCRLKKICQ
ncbi:MAG TPA: hypothetical protein DCL84_04820 [Eubacterium sp.]|nr:hypothetical protein [Eubacterium sp.]